VAPPQPDLVSALLTAVAHRNRELALRLGQQWVHRRGLDDLRLFVEQQLAPRQGERSANWFLTQLGLAEVAEPITLTPPQPVEESREPAPQNSSALFTRMKTLLRQRLEEAILGLESDGLAPETAEQPALQLAPLPPLKTRLRAVPPTSSPAPVSPALADLRAWLPEDHADLPRAS
jgi:hypothetical protein